MDIKFLRDILSEKLYYRDFVTDKTGVKTIEVMGDSFIADEPVIFGELNEDWSRREVAWYETMSRNVNDIQPPVPEIWRKVSDPDGFINSNYGWCIFSEQNGHQYDHAVEELRRNPDTRRAVMIYTRPSMWNDYNRDGMSDFICTGQVQYLIRNGKLNAVVQMRSSDLIYGYKGDRYWQDYVLEKVSRDVGVPKGDIIWQAGSAHIYARHFFLIQHWNETGELSVSKKKFREMYPDSEWCE